MAITTCRYCGALYDAGSEESANEPGRLCCECSKIEPRPVDSLGNVLRDRPAPKGAK